jgi:hypothetical protein
LQNSRNVLVASSAAAECGMVAKVADLGLSRAVKQNKTHRTTDTIGMWCVSCEHAVCHVVIVMQAYGAVAAGPRMVKCMYMNCYLSTCLSAVVSASISCLFNFSPGYQHLHVLHSASCCRRNAAIMRLHLLLLLLLPLLLLLLLLLLPGTMSHMPPELLRYGRMSTAVGGGETAPQVSQLAGTPASCCVGAQWDYLVV